MSTEDHSQLRAEMQDRWDQAAGGWRKRADDIKEFGWPVSEWIIEELELRPGQRVLELAAGPGDTGFEAAKQIVPGGTLICSDASEAMLEIARERAGALGLENVEFRRLELEWIDLETASVHAALCRWGLMLLVDPGAALQEIRRILRPGGRFATAVWDLAEHNSWATIPIRALVELGHTERPDPDAPGMFTLADSGRLRELMESAGFIEVALDTIKLEHPPTSLEDYIAQQLDISVGFAEARERLDDEQWGQVEDRIADLTKDFRSMTARSRSPRGACWHRPARSANGGYARRPRYQRSEHVLRRRRRPGPPRRQDRGHSGLWVAGPCPRAEPQGLRSVRRRGPAA